MEFFLPIIYSVILIAIIYRWRFFHLQSIPRYWLAGAFVLKIIAGLVLWYFYTHVFTNPAESDALRYFEDAMTIKRQWSLNRDVFWSFMLGTDTHVAGYSEIYDKLVGWTSGYRYGLTNDCSTIIRINVLLGFISGENYQVHSIVMSWLAFVGFAALYKSLIHFYTAYPKLLFAICFMMPSVVFWSSGLLKEGPLLLAFGMFCYSLSKLCFNIRNYGMYILLAASAFLMVYIKEYVLISMIPAMFFLLTIGITGKRFLIVKFIVVHALLFIAAENAHLFFTGGDFIYVLHKKQVDFYNVALLTDAGSVIDLAPVSDPLSFMLNYPAAFANTFFRPFLWEAKNFLYLGFSIENTVYLLITLLCLIYFKIPDKKQHIVLAAMISFVLVFSSIIGSCVPILGALVRYRIVALPVLMVVLVSCINIEKLRKHLEQLPLRRL